MFCEIHEMLWDLRRPCELFQIIVPLLLQTVLLLARGDFRSIGDLDLLLFHCLVDCHAEVLVDVLYHTAHPWANSPDVQVCRYFYLTCSNFLF